MSLRSISWTLIDQFSSYFFVFVRSFALAFEFRGPLVSNVPIIKLRLGILKLKLKSNIPSSNALIFSLAILQS